MIAARGIRRAWLHMRSLWPRFTLLPAAPFFLWAMYCLARGERRWELSLLIVLCALPYVSRASKEVYLGLAPLGLVAVLYDSMRFVQNAGIDPGRVHLCDLRAFEMRFFGISVNHGRATVHDWLQAHSVPALDVIAAIPYGTFLGAAALFALFLYAKDRSAMRRFGWCFLVLNVAGFITYHLYPAAPPWYFHAHGCNVDMLARASEGPNLARVDALLGFRYFAGFYGRSHDVFGAVPSLHVSYPLVILLEGWRHFGLIGRALAIAFFATMCFAAVYLDHHWIVDVVAGLAYGLLAYGAVHFVAAWV